MPRFFNPAALAAPVSLYSHAAEHRLGGRRLVISGQVGLRADGTVAEGLEAQMEVAFDNLLAVVAEAGMAVTDIVKTTAFVTVPGSVLAYRSVRDRKLQGHAPANTYLEVAGLALPAYLFEIEAEAVKDD